MDEKKLTHLTESGVHMVEVGDKPNLRRIAIAKGSIKLQKDTITLIEQGKLKMFWSLPRLQLFKLQNPLHKLYPYVIPSQLVEWRLNLKW
jgi:cyclic pyranopterin phosphate synthase